MTRAIATRCFSPPTQKRYFLLLANKYCDKLLFEFCFTLGLRYHAHIILINYYC